MKKMLFCSLAVTLTATVVAAGEGRVLRSTIATSVAPTFLTQSNDIPLPVPLSPTPDPLYSPSAQPYTGQYLHPPSPGVTGYPMQTPGYAFTAPPMELFSDVRYHGSRNISACAVPTIIQIPDPCNRDKCCKTCVNVQVCVPPCDPKRVRVTRDGNRVRYDYGKYAVVVKTVGDHIVVNYTD